MKHDAPDPATASQVQRPERITDHAATGIAAIVAMALIGMVPQARNVLFQLPSFGHGPAWVVFGFYLFLIGLLALDLVLLTAVVPGGRGDAFAGWIGAPVRWLQRTGIAGGLLAITAGVALVAQRASLSVGAFDAAFLAALGGLVVMAGLGCLWPSAIGPRPAREMLTRAWGGLLITLLVGQLVWFAAHSWPGVFSPRNATIWGITQCAFVIVLAGRVLDGAHRMARVDVRPWAALLLIAFTPFARRESIGSHGQAPEAEGGWLAALEARLDALPEDGPAVVVAASGGGARAALFAALVLEGLAGAPVEPGSETTLGDHLLLLSGVSGGSLACGWYATRFPEAPRAKLHSSFERELAARMLAFARRASEAAQATSGRVDPEVFTDVIATCEALDEALRSGADLPELPADFLSAFADDMAVDHMAPILRGLLLPGVGRGEALVDSWKRRFEWSDVDNLSWDPTGKPLVLLGATHAQRGRRLALGFPALRGDWLAPELDSLAAHDPGYRLGLAEAVRLSSGFPWLMPIAKLDVPTEDTGGPLDGDGLHVVDGGVVDNTGVDMILAIVRRLVACAEGDPRDPLVARARRVLNRLRSRGVLLVEIDSGAKKRGLSSSSSWLPGLEPVETLQIALDANAGLAADRGIDELRTLIARRPRTPLEEAPSAMHHVVFSADLFTDVMTAWALGPEDKAAVWATFLFGFPSNLEELRLAYWYHRRAASGGSVQQGIATSNLSPAERALLAGDGDALQAELDRRSAARAGALSVLAPAGSARKSRAEVSSRASDRLRGRARPSLVGVTASPSASDLERVFLGFDGGAPVALTGWRLVVEGGAAWELDVEDGVLEPGEVRPVLRRGRGGDLPDGGALLILYAPDGVEVDRWRYGPAGRGVLVSRKDDA